MADWFYDEYKHCGVDYSDAMQADNYDEQHGRFRDYEGEFRSMVEFLSLDNTGDMSVIDLGCGTGATSVYAARCFKRVYGVDVSDAMIKQARSRAEREKITNIGFVNAGFLTYIHPGEPADLLMTRAAFHHLPDFWKQVALLKMNRMLKKGGILYIFDVVFGFDMPEYETRIDDWISGFEKKAGMEFRSQVETHIRDEYSTFDWILEGMIERAGFRIERKRSSDGFLGEYHCVKTDEVISR